MVEHNFFLTLVSGELLPGAKAKQIHFLQPFVQKDSKGQSLHRGQRSLGCLTGRGLWTPWEGA